MSYSMFYWGSERICLLAVDKPPLWQHGSDMIEHIIAKANLQVTFNNPYCHYN